MWHKLADLHMIWYNAEKLDQDRNFICQYVFISNMCIFVGVIGANSISDILSSDNNIIIEWASVTAQD
jgi:hypothetical protein